MIRKLKELLMTWTVIVLVWLLGNDDWGLSASELGQLAILTIKLLKPLVSESGRVDLEEMEGVLAGVASTG